jgi:crotonobetainyl-CoA:carnitine CoA-transferase CaiB-like acyl-CoA transferase
VKNRRNWTVSWKRVLRKTTDEWLALFVKLEVPAGPINTVDKAVADPQVLSGTWWWRSNLPCGQDRDVGSPVKVSGVDQIRYLYPRPWESIPSRFCLLGYSADKIAGLKNQRWF